MFFTLHFNWFNIIWKLKSSFERPFVLVQINIDFWLVWVVSNFDRNHIRKWKKGNVIYGTFRTSLRCVWSKQVMCKALKVFHKWLHLGMFGFCWAGNQKPFTNDSILVCLFFAGLGMRNLSWMFVFCWAGNEKPFMNDWFLLSWEWETFHECLVFAGVGGEYETFHEQIYIGMFGFCWAGNGNLKYIYIKTINISSNKILNLSFCLYHWIL